MRVLPLLALCPAALGISVLGISATATAREAKADVATTDGLDRWEPVYAATAKTVEMTFTDERPDRLMLHREPLLHYTNPVRAVDQHGTIHLWTTYGPPAIVASFRSAHPPTRPRLRQLNFEWHSLSARPVRAVYVGETVWATGQAGLEWTKLADLPAPAPAPAPNERLRLLQLRRIAAGFSADIERGESELRLMKQPLYRYASKGSGIVEGAMFAFVMGTDPEFFLLIEARKSEHGNTAWHAGIVRFTNSALEVERDSKTWWTSRDSWPDRRTNGTSSSFASACCPPTCTARSSPSTRRPSRPRATLPRRRSNGR